MPHLKIPNLSEFLDPGLEIRPVYLEEWIEDLPYADIAVLIERLSDYLGNLNRSPIKPSLRWQLLERCLPPIPQILAQHLSIGHARGGFSCDPALLNMDHLVAEFGNGYKRVLNDGADARTWLGRNKTLRKTLLRAGFFNSLRFILAAEEYAVEPAGLWREAFTLYAWAEEREYDRRACESPDFGVTTPDTPHAQFAALILTSLLDPHRLPSGDIWNAYQLMSEFAPLADITRGADGTKLAGQFVIDLATDNRPAPLTRGAIDDLSDQQRVLSSQPLVTQIKLRLTTAQPKPTPRPSSPSTNGMSELMRHAARNLSLPRKRLMPRRDGSGRIRLTIGINALHHFLGGATTQSPAHAEADAGDVEIDLDSYRPAGIGTTYAQTFEVETWDLENQCLGGIGIMKQVQPTLGVRIGELMGIQIKPKAGNGEWAIGVIRWIAVTERRDFRVGIQMIATGAQPGSLTATNRSESAICVIAAASGREPSATVILPAGACSAGESVRLAADRGRQAVMLDTLVESTPIFERYRVKTLA